MDEQSLNNNMPAPGVEEKSSLILPSKEKDKTYEYFSERAKKLTTAIYLVTNLIPQTDPLRVSVRDFSIKLLSLIGNPTASHSSAQISFEVSGLCRKVLEMLEIAFFSGYVSEMNYSVLKTEFDVFAREIMGYDNPQTAINEASLRVGDISQNPMIPGPKGLKSRVNHKKAIVREDKAVSTKNVAEVKKTSRKEAILSIIKLKGSVSIKDVSSVIIDCSEKTIQRELTALVKEGALKKTGERRWSVYSLA